MLIQTKPQFHILLSIWGESGRTIDTRQMYVA